MAEIPGGSSLPGLGEPPSSEEDERGLDHYIPAQRQHLAYALRRVARNPAALVPTSALPIADVLITDACTACGLCAQFCPTEALSFVSDDEYYVLNFSAALCLGKDCSLCVIGCPTDAVVFGQEVTVEELLSTRPRPVKAGRLAPCIQCGGLTDVPVDADETPDTPLCYVCQAQADRADVLASLSSQEQGPE
jgi:ferredoxin